MAFASVLHWKFGILWGLESRARVMLPYLALDGVYTQVWLLITIFFSLLERKTTKLGELANGIHLIDSRAGCLRVRAEERPPAPACEACEASVDPALAPSDIVAARVACGGARSSFAGRCLNFSPEIRRLLCVQIPETRCQDVCCSTPYK